LVGNFFPVWRRDAKFYFSRGSRPAKAVGVYRGPCLGEIIFACFFFFFLRFFVEDRGLRVPRPDRFEEDCGGGVGHAERFKACATCDVPFEAVDVRFGDDDFGYVFLIFFLLAFSNFAAAHVGREFGYFFAFAFDCASRDPCRVDDVFAERRLVARCHGCIEGYPF
jgi:hypothetical protein